MARIHLRSTPGVPQVDPRIHEILPLHDRESNRTVRPG